jgi:Colicin D
MNFEPRQVQSKFKHAKDFGIEGFYTQSSGIQLEAAMEAHLVSPITQPITGTYRRVAVIHWFNSATNLNLISDLSDNFISGWKPSLDQVIAVTTTGNLGGG